MLNQSAWAVLQESNGTQPFGDGTSQHVIGSSVLPTEPRPLSSSTWAPLALPELKVKPWLSHGEGCGPPIKEEEEEPLAQEEPGSHKSCSSTMKDSSETPSSGIGTSSNSSWLDSQHPLKGCGSLLGQLGHLQAETQRWVFSWIALNKGERAGQGWWVLSPLG